MTSNPLPIEDNFQHSGCTSQTQILSNSPINHALVAVAQEVADLLEQATLFQVDDRHPNDDGIWLRSSTSL